MPYIDDAAILGEELVSLKLKLSTVDAGDAASNDRLYVNVVFADGTRLYEPTNFLFPKTPSPFGTDIGPLPGKGDEKTFELPVPPGLGRTLQEIAELFLRKPDDDGWFMGSALLFANGHDVPLIGSLNANQFLDYDDDVLLLREWSTRSACVAQATDAEHPLAQSGYRVLGPVLGQVSDTSAVVLYRVDRGGIYHFSAVDAITRASVANVTMEMEPTGRFELTGLQPDRRYEFDLRFVRAGVESPVPGAAGSLQTYPPEWVTGVFSFAFGSCANPNEQAAQGAWTAIRSLVEARPGMVPVSLFTHLGDTFYFYDHMTEEEVQNVESMQAAHVSMRRHIEFLDMATVVPCCAIWDDHDFAGDDKDSTDISSELRSQAVKTWMQYWGNNQPISLEHDHGLTTRISHGLVDIYLLDGRFNRDKDNGVCFGNELITDLLQMIDGRGDHSPRVVVLGTGSPWNHELNDDEEYYGDPAYKVEREFLFSELAKRMGRSINGLLLISGDDHINEIYHVNLGNDRMAPEFVCSPLTMNTQLKDSRDIEGERVASFSTKEDGGRRGFATLTIDTSEATTSMWTATVRYYQEAAATMYESRTYMLDNGGFVPA
jgi:phosphodiesterase/alkaline phosphatase D-like protein